MYWILRIKINLVCLEWDYSIPFLTHQKVMQLWDFVSKSALVKWHTFKHWFKKIINQLQINKFKKKTCESVFPYCFLTDFTKFFLWGSMAVDFGFLSGEASWIYRIFKIWYHDKKKSKNSIRLKFKSFDRFSQNLVSNIT